MKNLFLLFLVLGAPYSVRGAESPLHSSELESVENPWVFSFYFENDLFTDTDRYYTNGVKFSWVSPDLTEFLDAKLPAWMYSIYKDMPYIHEPGTHKNVALSFGQNIYTPEDYSVTELVEDDRPYAGWLYFGLGFHAKREHRQDTIEIQAGLVGPWALGEEAQNTVHQVRNFPKALGWDNQLHNEPIINVTYERRYRTGIHELFGDVGVDMIGNGLVTLGNGYTGASAGLEGRFGYNLPLDFGSTQIRAGGETNVVAPGFDRPQYGKYGLLFFASVEGHGVLRDITLDGNTFRDSHRVDKEPWVAEWVLGAKLRLDHWKFVIARVERTEQFKLQEGTHVYGSITASLAY